MSEEKETVEELPQQEEHQEHNPPKQRSGGSGAFLAILLALGALGTSYYLWQQLQIANTNASALKGEVNKLLGVIEQRHQDLMQRLQTVPDHQHPQISQRLDKMQSSLFELRSHLGQERRGWQVAEVDYLLRVAEHRLRLERDVATAIAALQTANQKLQVLNSPEFAPVIALINTDISKLSGVQLPDRDAMAAQVEALSRSVETLPLSTRAVQSGETPKATPSEPDAGSDSVWTRMWHDILGLVTIRREGEVERPMLVPEQRYFLRQNLQLKLESARIALLTGNDASWQAGLNEASTWLRRYFDESAAAVNDTLNTLAQLATVQLNPPLPQLSDTRRQLHQAAVQVPQQPNAAPIKQPPAAPAAPAKASQPKAAEQPVTPEKDTEQPPTAPASEAQPKASSVMPETPADSTAPTDAPVPADTPTEAEQAPEPEPATDTDVPQLPQGTGQ